MASFSPDRGWGANGKRAALSITFDNFGEAAWVEMGLWDKPIGAHYTASFLPTLINFLGDTPATYFMEASNVSLYPQAICAWQKAGHEVGLHAWRHENWGRVEPERRRMLLAKSIEAMRSIGIEPKGFRPPGGEANPEAWQEFEEAGLLYCSPAGAPNIARVGHMLSLPFSWPNVDAYVVEDIASPLRVACGDPPEAHDLAHWIANLDRAIEEAVDEGGHRTVIFHPEFLALSEEKMDVLRHVIEKAQQADMWIARAVDVATFVSGLAVRQSSAVLF